MQCVRDMIDAANEAAKQYDPARHTIEAASAVGSFLSVQSGDPSLVSIRVLRKAVRPKYATGWISAMQWAADGSSRQVIADHIREMVDVVDKTATEAESES